MIGGPNEPIPFTPGTAGILEVFFPLAPGTGFSIERQDLIASA